MPTDQRRNFPDAVGDVGLPDSLASASKFAVIGSVEFVVCIAIAMVIATYRTTHAFKKEIAIGLPFAVDTDECLVMLSNSSFMYRSGPFEGD